MEQKGGSGQARQACLRAKKSFITEFQCTWTYSYPVIHPKTLHIPDIVICSTSTNLTIHFRLSCFCTCIFHLPLMFVPLSAIPSSLFYLAYTTPPLKPSSNITSLVKLQAQLEAPFLVQISFRACCIVAVFLPH